MNTTLLPYQQQAKAFAAAHPKCGLFMDMGLGKTLTTLSLLEDTYNTELGHILVIAPKQIAMTTWEDEIQKWGIKIPYGSLIVDEKGRTLSRENRIAAYEKAIRNPVKTLYTINRDLIVDLVKYCKDNNYPWQFWTIVLDESHSFKGYSTKRFKALRQVMGSVRRLIALTGTPTPNSIEDLWSQIYLMDEGQRLGSTLTSFRDKFMTPAFYNNGRPVSYRPRDEYTESYVHNLVKDIAISMKNTMLKLPPLIESEVAVKMDDKEKKLYDEFKKNAVLEFDEMTATAANAAVMTAKLSQMASGSLYCTDEDNNRLDDYKIIHQRKLEMLAEMRESTTDNLLVSYWFKSDLDMLTKFCTKEKIPFEVWNSNNAKDILTRWNNKQIPMLFVQPQSAGAGLNFQAGGHTLIWYTLPWSLVDWKQMNARLYRQGQTETTYIHYLLTKGTIDSHILHTLQKKQLSEDKLLDAIELGGTGAKKASASAKTALTTEDTLELIRAALAEE